MKASKFSEAQKAFILKQGADGVPVAETLRYTRIWHKRADGWRLVAGHMSTVP